MPHKTDNLTGKVRYIIEMWPGAELDPQLLTVWLWRTFYTKHFNVPQEAVNSGNVEAILSWPLTVGIALKLPTVEAVKRALAEIRREREPKTATTQQGGVYEPRMPYKS